ncbi:hypothetical protein GAY28_03750 [Azospirillum brasilense]|nr:hypothetical protein [Azospirillum brasilense]
MHSTDAKTNTLKATALRAPATPEPMGVHTNRLPTLHGAGAGFIRRAFTSNDPANSNVAGCSAILIVNHARGRGRQRGKPRDVIQLVYANADCDCRAGRGRQRIWLSRSRCAELVQEGVRPGLIEIAARTVLVVSDADGAVITVLDARAA